MNFNKGGFLAIAKRRPYYLKVLLESYNCIIYTDIDTVWQADPRLYFKGDFDFWGQIDGVLNGLPYTRYV